MIKLIFYKNNQWHLCGEKVKYIQHDEEIEQYVGSEGRDWWLDFEEKWEHTEIIEFIDVKPSEEQLNRFNEMLELNLGDGYSFELGEYVENAIFPDGFNHVLRPLQIMLENQRLGIEMSEREIQEIIQGQQLSDLEIQILELQLGVI